MSASATYARNGGRASAAAATSSSWWWWPTSTTDAWNDVSTSAAYARLERTSTSTYAWNGRRTSATTYARNGPSTATDGGIISTAPGDTNFASWAKTEKEVGSRWSTEKSKLEGGMCNLFIFNQILHRRYNIDLNINSLLG